MKLRWRDRVKNPKEWRKGNTMIYLMMGVGKKLEKTELEITEGKISQ